MEGRNCCNVIREIISVVPKDNVELIKDLEWNLKDASFKAPEETIQWIRTQETLIKHIPTKPTEEWHFKVWSIFSTMSVEEIKREILK